MEDCSYADEGLFYNYYNYCSGFSYNGLRIIIDHNDKEQLEADARITVYKPFGNNWKFKNIINIKKKNKWNIYLA